MERTMIWKRLDGAGIEYCTHSWGKRTKIRGKVIRSDEDGAVFVEYSVLCDELGNTEQVDIEYVRPDGTQTMILQKDAEHRWTRNGVRLPALDGLKDIDIGVTPSTNWLPIRRLRLGIGESEEMTAAWVRFPEFEVQPLQQMYVRIDETTYEYRSVTGFKALLRTDDEGVVREYEAAWAEVDEAGFAI